MKGNKGLYILLPLVAIVWGIIIYRIVKYIGQENVAVTQPVLNEIKFEPEKFQNDTFSIVADYRDPFLSSSTYIKSNPNSSTKKNTATVSTPSSSNAKLKMPVVAFKGIVRNKKSDKVLAILKINDKTKTLTKGQTVDGVQLLNVSRDSIQIISLGIKNVIHRK